MTCWILVRAVEMPESVEGAGASLALPSPPSALGAVTELSDPQPCTTRMVTPATMLPARLVTSARRRMGNDLRRDACAIGVRTNPERTSVRAPLGEAAEGQRATDRVVFTERTIRLLIKLRALSSSRESAARVVLARIAKVRSS